MIADSILIDGKLVNHLAMLAPVVSVPNLHYNNMNNAVINLLASNEPQLSTSLGALNPMLILPKILQLSESICKQHKLRNFPCNSPNDEIFGYGSNQFDESVATNGAMSWSGESSFHELSQIIQATYGNDCYYFDSRNPLVNRQTFGSIEIPRYNLDKIAIKSLSIWRGNTDRFANQYDTYLLGKKLSIGSKYALLVYRIH